MPVTVKMKRVESIRLSSPLTPLGFRVTTRNPPGMKGSPHKAVAEMLEEFEEQKICTFKVSSKDLKGLNDKGYEFLIHTQNMRDTKGIWASLRLLNNKRSQPSSIRKALLT